MNITEIIDACNELASSKGLTREDVVFALEEALKAAYTRYLGGSVKDMADPVVIAHLDEEKGKIELAQIKKVVDEVEDDYLEISVEDANEGLKKAKYKAGDDYAIPASVDELSKVFAMAVRNNFRQKLAEAERSALYEIYKDHIGEMMVGTVEKANDRNVTVSIGRAMVELGRRELIGDEYFRVGDLVKVYIQEVKSANATEEDGKRRGPQIEATRSAEGFLKRLFEEEIHEIYDGTVIIKAIARKAGVRSKVAVMSTNEDIDATGACIGQGGSRIQKIVAQLGNGKNKEKIDVINYSPNLGVFITEACRPAVLLGVGLAEVDEKGVQHAYAVINDGDLPIAMGKYKSNSELANRLTGCKIEFIEAKYAAIQGISYKSVEQWKEEAEEEKKEAERQAYLRKAQEEAARREALAKEEEAKKEEKPVEAKPEEKKPEAPKASAREEEFPSEAINPAAAALAAARAADEARKAAEEKKEEEPREVKTTTTLSDLEKELEASKEKKVRSAAKAKRPRKITEEEVKHESVVKPAVNAMPVYTEEELSQMELEETQDNDVYDDEDVIDEDYNEYEEYYDDDNA